MGWSTGGASACEQQLREGTPPSPELLQTFRLAVQTQHSLQCVVIDAFLCGNL